MAAIFASIDAASIGWAFGAAMLGASCLRAAWGAIALGERQRTRETLAHHRRDHFAKQLTAALEWARSSQPRWKAWTGMRKFRVTRVVDDSKNCRSYYLAPLDGRSLPRYSPGQYLTFHLPARRSGEPIVRCYSLSDRPREDTYRVTVKRALAPANCPEAPPGQGSGYFHDLVGEGSQLEVEAPQGAFFLDPTDQLPVVLIGGGIGVTPLVSMAAAMTEFIDPRTAYLFVGVRNGREHPLRAETHALAERNPRLHLNIAYSRPLVDDRLGSDFDQHGRVDVAHLRRNLPSNNFRFYVCGPPGMMESLIPELLAWGVPREHLHFEAFGPASVRGLGHPSTEKCEVRFAQSGETLTWDGSESSLMALAEKQGLSMEAGCRAGSCGQCRVALAAGAVIHVKPPGVELADGECLPCIAAPAGDVILEA